MPFAATVQHELYVWDAQELLEVVRQAPGKVHAGLHRAGELVRKRVEANEYLAHNYDTDVVALSLLAKSSGGVVQQIRLLGVMGRAYVKIAKNGKKVIVFKGLASARPRLQGTRYLLENPKVRCFVIGTEEIVKDAGKATKIAVVAFVAIDILNEVTADHFSLARLGVNVASHVLQAAAAAYAGAVAGVLITTAVAGAPVVITFMVVVGVGFVVGSLLTWADNRYHLTEWAQARMMGYEAKLKGEALKLGHEVAAAGRQVAAYEQRTAAQIAAAAYSVDRYFQSVEQMLQHDLAGFARR